MASAQKDMSLVSTPQPLNSIFQIDDDFSDINKLWEINCQG